MDEGTPKHTDQTASAGAQQKIASKTQIERYGRDERRSRVLLGLISVTLAVLLWFNASLDKRSLQRIIQVSLSLPLVFTDEADGFKVTRQSAETVVVTLEGTADRMREIEDTKPSPIKAAISLQGLRHGQTLRLPVQIESPTDVELISTVPRLVEFYISRIIERSMKVMLERPDDDEGEVSSIEFDPPEIIIKGPETEVLNVRYAAVEADSATIASSVSLDLPVVLRDGSDTIVEGLTVEPASVVLTAVVRDPLESRAVRVVQPVRGRPQGGDLGSVKVTPEMVTIRGPKEALANITELALDPIDISDFIDDMVLTVSIESPSTGVEVVDAKSVRVEIDVVKESKVYSDVPIGQTGAIGSRVWQLTPPTASVTVERSDASSEPLADGAPPLELYVDVTNIVTDQVTLPVLARDVRSGASVIKIEPPQVSAVSVRSADK